MSLDIESTLFLFFFFLVQVVFVLCAAKVRPKSWRRMTYLIVFAIALIIDTPLLLTLYLTTKVSPAFGWVDLISDLAVVGFGAVWGCLFGFSFSESSVRPKNPIPKRKGDDNESLLKPIRSLARPSGAFPILSSRLEWPARE